MVFNVLVESTAAVSRTICGAEIADPVQTANEITTRNTDTYNVVRNGVKYEYKMVNTTSSVDEFLNNYHLFFLSGGAIYRSANTAITNRFITDFNRSIPYVNENMIQSLV